MPKTDRPNPPVDCENCKDPVHRTRPSRTGVYYCRKPACQAARRKAYRARTTGGASSADIQAQIDLAVREVTDQLSEARRAVIYVGDLSRRQRCPVCGLADAIRGLLHPSPERTACEGVGPDAGAPNPATYVPYVWPVGRRVYVPAS